MVKIKQVDNVDAMEYNLYNAPPTPNLAADKGADFQQGYPAPSSYVDESHVQLNAPRGSTPPVYMAQTLLVPQASFQNVPGNLGVIGQPIIQDLAMQYGQQLATAGKGIIEGEIRKFVHFANLKYYFAVDTKYVVTKLMLLLFPFTHSDWSLKYDPDSPIQPRFEINAPDLYIPTMAFWTHVLVASFALGMQNRFTPEQLGIIATSALTWWLIELSVYLCTPYIIQIKIRLQALDFLAYSGYKFVSTSVSVLIGALIGKTGYYIMLSYMSLALAFFMIRSLRVAVLQQYYDPGKTDYKPRRYFLLFLAGIQPLLSWWLSYQFV